MVGERIAEAVGGGGGNGNSSGVAAREVVQIRNAAQRKNTSDNCEWDTAWSLCPPFFANPLQLVKIERVP